MADHGKNKRRSHHARKRQRIGKYKRDLHKKESAKKIKKWFVFWNKPLDEIYEDLEVS